MTDGIIQEVLGFMYVEYLKHPDMSISALLNITEQELIEKIKTRQFRISYKFSDKVVKLKDLIGDNKE